MQLLSFLASLMLDWFVTRVINQLISQHRAATLPQHLHCLPPQGSHGWWRKGSLKGAGEPGVGDAGGQLGRGGDCGDVEHKSVKIKLY